MSSPLTNIRVFVHWTEQTVFAGEDIECDITFKNVATTVAPPRATLHPAAANGLTSGERQRKGPVAQIKNNTLSPRLPQIARGHRTTLSLSAPVTSVRSSRVGSESWNGGHSRRGRESGSHKRSVSIISIGASETVADDARSQISLPEGRGRLPKGHGRSASLQILPRKNGIAGGPISAPIGLRSSTQPSPLISSVSAGNTDYSLPERPSRRQSGIATAPSTPGIGGVPFTRRQGSVSFSHGFKFPMIASSAVDTRTSEKSTGDGLPDSSRLLSQRSKDSIPMITEQAAPPAARILSPASMTGTPRSSGEFYSLSNHSTETLASEYLPHQHGRTSSTTGHARVPSNLGSVNHHRPPETLMMGYAQIHGSFTLDGSLVNQAPFEEVKRKGAVGGQGGGVIGVERNKRDSGLLGGFGWGNFSESLGGLLGGGELSSIKEMRGIASSRSVPLLSTPQSILFVDLRLAPGESKTFKYSFKLPRGLPPSHRGKAIKIAYKLIIGTQRPGGAKEQQVKSVEVPFRLLGSVNSHGELLGHDLMSPYMILRDQARIKMIEATSTNSSQETLTRGPSNSRESTLDDFMSYVDELLTRPRHNSSYGLLSPTDAPRSRRPSSIEGPASAKEAIDMAILRSNTATETQHSANRFEIARGGKRVAVVMLARPAYRLGETITAAIDFTDAEIPCYAIHASLESSEKIDNSIALRSEASIMRVTRKTYASHSESTLFARRVMFSPTIPVTATPEFITSGVSLDWRIRIEFVTPQLANGEVFTDLLEEVASDDRGITLAAAEAIDCESFEIAVPLRVYGALAGNAERDENPVEGLVV